MKEIRLQDFFGEIMKVSNEIPKGQTEVRLTKGIALLVSVLYEAIARGYDITQIHFRIGKTNGSGIAFSAMNNETSRLFAECFGTSNLNPN